MTAVTRDAFCNAYCRTAALCFDKQSGLQEVKLDEEVGMGMTYSCHVNILHLTRVIKANILEALQHVAV